MIDRRQFLKTNAVILAGGLMLPDPLLRSAAMGKGKAETLIKVIYDARIPASCAFAQSACRSGISAVESRGDVGALWHNAIVPGLRPASQQLIGLTLASDLFLLKLLAADMGMKVLHEAPHASSGSLVFWVIAGRADGRIA